MTLKQLRILREIARQSMNISSAATALFTSQPGVSRQIQLLERELAVDLLVRRRNRILAFTDAGRAVLDAAQRLLAEAENIRRIAADARADEGGRLALATSHLHARYTLLGPVKAFSRRYPKVQLHMLQADPDDIARLVEENEADIGVSTETAGQHPRLIQLPCGPIRRSLITPKGHPLARRRGLTLADLSRYPIVGYHPRSRGGQIITRAFRDGGIEARFVVSANDSDVIKAYVAEGLGIAVVPTLALDRGADKGIHAADITALFPASEMTLSLRRDTYLSGYLADFIQMVVPRWNRQAIERLMQATDVPAAAGRARDRAV
ncbi:MAG TPA: LysR substrate-binding domain-containing protein [Burkholderiales bacterium]|nr:LysR substrate-binding domain-containing protein [Burkholderiales bacterium]